MLSVFAAKTSLLTMRLMGSINWGEIREYSENGIVPLSAFYLWSNYSTLLFLFYCGGICVCIFKAEGEILTTSVYSLVKLVNYNVVFPFQCCFTGYNALFIYCLSLLLIAVIYLYVPDQVFNLCNVFHLLVPVPS